MRLGIGAWSPVAPVLPAWRRSRSASQPSAWRCVKPGVYLKQARMVGSAGLWHALQATCAACLSGSAAGCAWKLSPVGRHGQQLRASGIASAFCWHGRSHHGPPDLWLAWAHEKAAAMDRWDSWTPRRSGHGHDPSRSRRGGVRASRRARRLVPGPARVAAELLRFTFILLVSTGQNRIDTVQVRPPSVRSWLRWRRVPAPITSSCTCCSRAVWVGGKLAERPLDHAWCRIEPSSSAPCLRSFASQPAASRRASAWP